MLYEELPRGSVYMRVRRIHKGTLSLSLLRILEWTLCPGTHGLRTTVRGEPTSEKMLCSVNKAQLRQLWGRARCPNWEYPTQLCTLRLRACGVADNSKKLLVWSSTVGHIASWLWHSHVNLVLFGNKGYSCWQPLQTEEGDTQLLVTTGSHL